MEEYEKTIAFETEDGTVNFIVISETKLNGANYVLVSEPDGDEGIILKEIQDENEDIVYEMVDDDNEIDAVGEVFRAILEDIDLI